MADERHSLIVADGITRTYPGVKALDDVSLSIAPGRVHVLAGENGAGKSTLVKILTGTERATSGTIAIHGEHAGPGSALFQHVAYVPQEVSVFDHLSVTENLLFPLSRVGMDSWTIRPRQLKKRAQELLDAFAIDARPGDEARHLSVSDQQMLMIARACAQTDLSALILDEPTSSLTLNEVERLFDVVRRLRSEGKGIVFISHKSDEIFEIGDEVTVLRNGKAVDHRAIADIDERQLLAQMAGREVELDGGLSLDRAPGDVLLSVENLSGPGFADVSFELRAGEVLGFAGLVGAGRSEIMQTLCGARSASAGRVSLHGQAFAPGNVADAIRHGLVYIPEERKQHGVLPMQSVRHNIGVSLFGETARGGFISGRREKQRVRSIVDQFEVKTPSLGQRMNTLSGGNQQKAILGRALAMSPQVLILDEPTRGIDVRTKVEIYRLIRELAESGLGVIVVSSDLDELRQCATRFICLYEGRIHKELTAEDASNQALVSAIVGQDTAS